jgi:hypothetical protein
MGRRVKEIRVKYQRILTRGSVKDAGENLRALASSKLLPLATSYPIKSFSERVIEDILYTLSKEKS